MPLLEAGQIIAPIDIAAMLRVGPSAVTNWTTRNVQPVPFPSPIITVAGGNVNLYDRRQVLAWHFGRTGIAWQP